MSENTREKLADVQHSIWAHWMVYMWNCGTYNEDGTWTMPADKVERWQRQAGLKYSGLTEREKDSDRDQADKIIMAIRHLLEAAILAEDYGQRAEAAEAKLALVDTFAEWKRNAPKGSLTFAEWLKGREETLQFRR